MNVSTRTLLFSFVGRINRATYWTRAFPILLALGLFVMAALALEFRTLWTQGVVSFLLSLVGLWPVLAIAVKRLHDRGRSAWFLLTFFVPVLGAIWLLMELWFLPGTRGANRFGEVPQDTGLDLRWIIPFEAAGVAALISLLAWTFFWPGEEFARALRANGYELIRMEAPVSGLVTLPAGNSLILMEVDGSARIGNVEISQCTRMALENWPQTCRLDVSGPDGFGYPTIFIGSGFATPAFSIDTAKGRAIVILHPDLLGSGTPNADIGWLIPELNRPYF